MQAPEIFTFGDASNRLNLLSNHLKAILFQKLGVILANLSGILHCASDIARRLHHTWFKNFVSSSNRRCKKNKQQQQQK